MFRKTKYTDGKYLFLLNKKYNKVNKITNCLIHDFLTNGFIK